MATQFNELGKRSRDLFHDVLTGHNSGNLTSLFRLNEKSGNPVDACERYKLSLTTDADNTYSASLATGIVGITPGASGKLTGSDAAPFDVEYTQAKSYMIIAKLSSLAGSFYTKFTGQRGEGWYIDANKHVMLIASSIAGSAYIYKASTASLATGTLYLLHMTYTGSGLASGVTLWRQGVEDTAAAALDTLAAGTILNDTAPEIGPALVGSIAMFASWNTALSAEDVKRHAYLLGVL